mgnify:CR=1
MLLRQKTLKAVRLSLSKPVRVYDVKPPSTIFRQAQDDKVDSPY